MGGSIFDTIFMSKKWVSKPRIKTVSCPWAFVAMKSVVECCPLISLFLHTTQTGGGVLSWFSDLQAQRDLNPCSKSGTELDLWSRKSSLTSSQRNEGQQQLAVWLRGDGQVSSGKIGRAVHCAKDKTLSSLELSELQQLYTCPAAKLCFFSNLGASGAWAPTGVGSRSEQVFEDVIFYFKTFCFNFVGGKNVKYLSHQRNKTRSQQKVL